jgi:hypothetical protein
MAYNLTRSDGTLFITIDDGLTDKTSSSLSFIGRNVSNYGQSQNNNFLHLLENFSSDVAPANPIRGQLWFNKSNQKIYAYTDTGFVIVGPGGSSEIASYANNLVGGSAGSIPYQSATSSTSFLSIGSNNTVLFSNGNSVSWRSALTLNVANAVSAGTATTALNANNASFADQAALAITALTANLANTASNSVTLVNSNKSTAIATTEFVHNILPTGVILMWSGPIASIPSGWALCDGGNGTPDLRNRFIVGAGITYSVGDTGGSTVTNYTVLSAGTHSHLGSTVAHTLTVNQIPSHSHLLDDAFYSEINGSNVYNDPVSGPITVGPTIGSNRTDSDNGLFFFPHNTYRTGNGQAHSHGIVNDGSHTHVINPTDNRPPYYALCYIMKIV